MPSTGISDSGIPVYPSSAYVRVQHEFDFSRNLSNTPSTPPLADEVGNSNRIYITFEYEEHRHCRSTSSHPLPYFHPNTLLQRLSHMPQLETFGIAFTYYYPGRDVGRQWFYIPHQDARHTS